MINRLLSSEITKWVFVIGVVIIGVGFIVMNVISYSIKCMKEEIVKGLLPEGTLRNHFTS